MSIIVKFKYNEKRKKLTEEEFCKKDVLSQLFALNECFSATKAPQNYFSTLYLSYIKTDDASSRYVSVMRNSLISEIL